MTAAIQSFESADSAAGLAAVTSLAPPSGARVFTWRAGTKTFIAYYA